MPVKINGNITRLAQHEFAAIAYEVVNAAFSVHEELGSLFDESVYREALANHLKGSETEVRIDVTFQDFRKPYFLDIVYSGGGIFELKAVKKLNAKHRSQLLNYLLLTETSHGKLINFGGDRVEHEFVNTTLTHADRIAFCLDEKEWSATDGFGQVEKNLVCDILSDWGTGLDCALYRDALFHFLGGEDQLLKKVGVFRNGRCVAQQVIPFCGESTTLCVTAFQSEKYRYEQQLVRLMQATRVESAQWINIARKTLTFKTLHFSVNNFSVNK